MKAELEIWTFLAERIANQKRVMLLVVVESKGSSPGRQGFKMAVAEDGLFGSIGGGVMEVSMVEEALAGFGEGTPIKGAVLVSQVHRESSPYSSGMICSGEQKLVMLELSKPHLETVGSIVETLEANKSGILEISDDKFEFRETGSMPREPRFEFRHKTETGKGFVYRERTGLKDQLFIVGGGHCALALSELMSKLDFDICLFDDRPGLNTIVKNEFAKEIRIISSYDEIERFIPSGVNHFVVVMTIGFKFDKLVIEKLVERDFAYFGVLGSRAKMAVLLRELENEGFSRDRLDKIHTPIGIAIGSRTPVEIAVSIAAEIIAVRNRKG